MIPDLPYPSLREAADALKRRRVSARELAEIVLQRIAELNPRIGAFTDEMAETALRDADRVDRKRRSGSTLGPLAGIPVGVKDLIDTTPAICSGGLPFLAGYRPSKDALAVRRLRRAGAIVVGVTATDPGAFDVRTLAVRHPQDPSLIVGGSSGGSGAALAAGLCYAALGTDTGGSIRIPSACCAVAGLKPTHGRVPLDGVRPLVWSLDHVGPMARRADDLALVHAALDPSAFRGRRSAAPGTLAVAHDPAFPAHADPVVLDATRRAIEACADLGCRVREVALPRPDDVLEVHGTIFATEAAAYHMATFPQHRSEYSRLAREMFDFADKSRGVEYVRAYRRRDAFRQAMRALYREIDFLIVPTLPVPTPGRATETVRIGSRQYPVTLALIRYTCLFDHTGQPVVAMPSGTIRPGLSTGIQIVGGLGRDAETLAFASRLERALGLAVDHSVAA